MKLFEDHWGRFTEALRDWECLRAESRRAYLQMKTGQNASPGAFGGDLAMLLERGFLQRHPSGGHVTIHDEARPFSRSIRAIARHPVLFTPTAQGCAAYLRDHFEREELSVLVAADTNKNSCPDPAAAFAAVIPASWRVSRFLGLKNPEDWEARRHFDGLYRLHGIGLEDAQSLLGQLSSLPPTPITALLALSPVGAAGRLGSALGVLIRYALVFPAINPRDDRVVVGVWQHQLQAPMPSWETDEARATRRQKAVPPTDLTGAADPTKRAPDAPIMGERAHWECRGADRDRPGPVQASEEMDRCLAVEDLCALLRLAMLGPVPMKPGNYSLFARAMKQFRPLLTPFPDWIMTDTDGLARERGRRAVIRAERLALGHVIQRETCTFEITPAGRTFITRPELERAQAVLDYYRHDAAASSRGHTNSVITEDRLHSPFFPGYVVRGDYTDDDRAIQAAFIEAVRNLPKDGWIDFDAWKSWHGELRNPLLPKSPINPVMIHGANISDRFMDERQLRGAWRTELSHFALDWLLPLGAVRTGRYQCRHGTTFLCIGRTPVLEYLLRDRSTLLLRTRREPGGQVLIQPNFEAMFLAPNPEAEGMLAGFCERLGHGTGAIFRITRKSVFTAVGAGLTADDMLASLRSAATKGVPANVEHEIGGWVRACKRIEAARPVILRCPDPETAAAVRHAAGKDGELLGETIVEIKSGKLGGDLRKKLVGLGIFVTDPA